MSINESVKLRRSNLTKEQRREAEAAIYGLSTKQMIDQLSPEEIERMRQIVAQHDQTSGKNGIKEFDLNNPPRLPYRFQEYPKTVYDHEGRRSFIVRNREDEKEALESGLRLDPYPSEPVESEVQLSAAELAEIEKLDKIAKRPRKQAQ
jgi:hypothetical protein